MDKKYFFKLMILLVFILLFFNCGKRLGEAQIGDIIKHNSLEIKLYESSVGKITRMGGLSSPYSYIELPVQPETEWQLMVFNVYNKSDAVQEFTINLRELKLVQSDGDTANYLAATIIPPSEDINNWGKWFHRYGQSPEMKPPPQTIAYPENINITMTEDYPLFKVDIPRNYTVAIYFIFDITEGCKAQKLLSKEFPTINLIN